MQVLDHGEDQKVLSFGIGERGVKQAVADWLKKHPGWVQADEGVADGHSHGVRVERKTH